MEVRSDYLYTKTHEWVLKIDEDTYRVGLSDYAQNQLGDLVFVNLPDIDDTVEKEEGFGDVESVKAVSDIYSPFTGVVSNINEELLDSPESVNNSCYEAWFIEVNEISDKSELMDASEYQEYLNTL